MRRAASLFFLCLMICTTSAYAHGSTRNVILIHGSWHGAWAWHLTQTMLESAGYRVYVPDLPAHGIDGTAPAAVTLDSYVQKVAEILDSLSEPAVLVGHSMGGVVVSQVGEVRPTRVEKLVYVAGFMPMNGESMIDLLNRDLTSKIWVSVLPNPAEGRIDLISEKVRELFYGETPSQFVTLARTLLRPDPFAPASAEVTLTASNYGRLPRYYVMTNRDAAITPKAQAAMIASQPCTRVYSIESDHSPFFSHPHQLNSILQRILTD